MGGWILGNGTSGVWKERETLPFRESLLIRLRFCPFSILKRLTVGKEEEEEEKKEESGCVQHPTRVSLPEARRK